MTNKTNKREDDELTFSELFFMKHPELADAFTPESVVDLKKPRKSQKHKARKTKTPPLKGNIQSGILFIGDPAYMAGDMSQPNSENVVDLDNPFKNWGRFTDSLNDQDKSLPFPGAIDEANSSGRGIAVQTNRLSGRFEIEKKYDKAGKLSQIVVKFYE